MFFLFLFFFLSFFGKLGLGRITVEDAEMRLLLKAWMGIMHARLCTVYVWICLMRFIHSFNSFLLGKLFQFKPLFPNHSSSAIPCHAIH